MSSLFDDTNRQVVPRFLDYSTACSIGILRLIKKEVPLIRRVEPITVQNWQTDPQIATAVDLVGEALILKDFDSQDAIKAANYILKNTNSPYKLVRALADHFLIKTNTTYLPHFESEAKRVNNTLIKNLKKSIRFYQLNPIAWSDLAFAYANLGQIEKARMAMTVAVNLGNQNRFILRSASRLFMHLGEPDRAINILHRSGLWQFDPWIASGEIAISESMNLKSKIISKARVLIQDDNLTKFARSELISCLGTMEAKYGSGRRSRQLMRQALVDPTENTLAQIEWLMKQQGIQSVDEESIINLRATVPASFEAKSRRDFYNKNFLEALKATKFWCNFQPFSSRPITLASFISAVCLEDDKEAIHILEACPPAQRKDPTITNNYAFSLARIGEIEKAEQAINKINLHTLSERQKLVLGATTGLIYFRKNKPVFGRKLYSAAIRGFDILNDQRSSARAAYFWAVEEKRIASNSAKEHILDAKTRIERNKVFELEDLAAKL